MVFYVYGTEQLNLRYGVAHGSEMSRSSAITLRCLQREIIELREKYLQIHDTKRIPAEAINSEPFFSRLKLYAELLSDSKDFGFYLVQAPYASGTILDEAPDHAIDPSWIVLIRSLALISDDIPLDQVFKTSGIDTSVLAVTDHTPTLGHLL